jgi:hypothetical protein
MRIIESVGVESGYPHSTEHSLDGGQYDTAISARSADSCVYLSSASVAEARPDSVIM